MKEAFDLLGKKVRDRVTNFQGIVSSVCFDLYGCIQAIVNPGVGADGKVGDNYWYDIKRLEVLDHNRVMEVPDFYPQPEKQIGPESKPGFTKMPFPSN